MQNQKTMSHLNTLTKILLLLSMLLCPPIHAQETDGRETSIKQKIAELNAYWAASDLEGVLSIYTPGRSPINTMDYTTWKETLAAEINQKKWQLEIFEFFPYVCTTPQNQCIRAILQRPDSGNSVKVSRRQYEWQQIDGDWHIVRESMLIDTYTSKKPVLDDTKNYSTVSHVETGGEKPEPVPDETATDEQQQTVQPVATIEPDNPEPDDGAQDTAHECDLLGVGVAYAYAVQLAVHHKLSAIRKIADTAGDKSWIYQGFPGNYAAFSGVFPTAAKARDWLKQLRKDGYLLPADAFVAKVRRADIKHPVCD